MPSPTHVVLLEGASDVAAVRAVAAADEVDLTTTRLVDLGGVTNIRQVLRQWRQRAPEVEIVGMCDAGETRFVERAIAAEGAAVRDASDLAAYGFFVCHADLEEELIRALGSAAALEVVTRLGLGGKFATLRQQPAWQERPVADQLHRFCGVASGRKELLAGALAAALTAEQVPEPIRLLIDRVRPGH